MERAEDVVVKVIMENGGLSEWDLVYVRQEAWDIVRALNKAGLLKESS